MNIISLTGNLGRNNEIKQLSSGTTVLNNSIGVHSNSKVGGEYKTSWFNVSIFGKSAEEYKEYYTTGYQTDVDNINITDNTIEYIVAGESKTFEYNYVGYEILTDEKGNRGVRFLFETNDPEAGKVIGAIRGKIGGYYVATSEVEREQMNSTKQEETE